MSDELNYERYRSEYLKEVKDFIHSLENHTPLEELQKKREMITDLWNKMEEANKNLKKRSKND